jgi:tol-pal system protein YbgF
MIQPRYALFLATVIALAIAGPAEVSARGDGAGAIPVDRSSGAHAMQVAQADATDLVVRLERLEGQIRQLTGAIEQLQYRNQQLEQQLRRIQSPTAESRPPEPGSSAARYAPPVGQQSAPPQAERLATGGDAAPPPQTGPRRGGVFDPNQNPNAPGAPKNLGQLSAGASPGYTGTSPPGSGAAAASAATPGAPMPLGSVPTAPSEEPTVIPAPQYGDGGPLPAPPTRHPNATGAQQLVMAPSATPKDEYDLAYGYVLRKDYVLAEENFRMFIKQFPNDRQVPDATYWLGESLFQEQRYRDAAEAFLTVSTKFENAPKAAESLLRLGQSLAALGEKEAACSTFGQVGRKYPRAAHLRQAVEREQKRVGC